MAEPTEPIPSGTNGSHADTVTERESLAYRSIIKECLKFNGKYAEDEVKWYEDKVKNELKKNGERYEDFYIKFYFKMEVYNDPIHGSIQLNPLEHAIVNTPEFYRLKEIKQLGGKNHVFPGAVHTRFEHSIGVCHLAGVFIKHLKQRSTPEGLTEQEELCVRLAGLCHDLGHGPFSHLFEGVMRKIAGKEFRLRKHEEISVMIFKRILLENTKVLIMFEKCDLTDEHVRMIGDMINCSTKVLDRVEKKKTYLYEIVANKKSGMDVDKWDYFSRDCHYLGLKNEFDMGRCIALSSIVKRDGKFHVGFREKEKRNIYGMFRTRCVLYQKAYYHKTADGIEIMIKDALFQAKDIPLQLPSTTDDDDDDGNNNVQSASEGLNQQVPLDDERSGTPGTQEESLQQHGSGVNSDPNAQEETSIKKIIQKAMEENDLSGYILLTDSILRTLMLIPTPPDKMRELRKVQELVQRIAKRDVYTCIFDEPFCRDECKSPNDIEALKSGSIYLEDFEIENIAIKYASEESEDPVADNMYFFEKRDGEVAIPLSRRITDEKPESKLNLPKAFVEYRIRLYYKKNKLLCEKEKESIKKRFRIHVKEEMDKVKKTAHD